MHTMQKKKKEKKETFFGNNEKKKDKSAAGYLCPNMFFQLFRPNKLFLDFLEEGIKSKVLRPSLDM